VEGDEDFMFSDKDKKPGTERETGKRNKVRK